MRIATQFFCCWSLLNISFYILLLRPVRCKTLKDLSGSSVQLDVLQHSSSTKIAFREDYAGLAF